MKRIFDQRFIKKILLIFLAIQPVLDCYLLYTDEIIGFFHFSPTTIIRLLIIGILFVLLFFNKDNKSTRKTIYIYGGLLLVYLIIHHFVAAGIDNSGYSTFQYSIVTEAFYIIRMLLPLSIIYITYTLKPSKEEVIKLFLAVSAIVSIVIVGSNLIQCSLASYGGGVIKGNFFDWFLDDSLAKNELASKGWFNSANQISGLMYILLPMCIYSLFNKFSIPRTIITFLTVLSMIMLGTRVASYGWFLIFIMMFVFYLFFIFVMKKNSFSIKSFISLISIFVVSLIIMPNGPLVNVSSSYTDEDDKKLTEMKEDENISTKELLGYIGINEIYYEEIYVYEDHEKFWEYVVEDVPATKRVGNRNSQQLITDDVSATYETPIRSLVGLGYSRFINAYLYLEKDFIVQYHTIGILGIILFLLPYIAIALYSFVRFIKYKKLNLFNLTLLAMLVLPLCISYFSGHIVDELIITLYLGFIAGYLVHSSRKEALNEES